MEKKHMLRKRAITAIVSASLVGATISSVAVADETTSSSDRTLQSVSVGIGKNGSVDTISDTRLLVKQGNKIEGSTDTHTYDPAEAAKDLPVRIIPSYVTKDKSGTDLNDLAGYTGRVTLFLSVQNLTLKPEDVSYDVAGQSNKRVDLVGTPLTVVAASSLGIPVEKVVTSSASGLSNVTNGVISQGEDGDAQIQWATILAPPQLPASTVFTVVADVKEFEVPEFDITVQPGYVSDASTGEVLDEAFRTSIDTDSELILQTIHTMTELDDLLGEVGSTISQARSDLRTSAETVGSRTITDLQQSMGSITTSTEQMISTLTALESSVSQTLESSNSALLGQISDTISTVSTLLGDPQQTTPNVQFVGEGCQAKVGNQADTSSIFGSILNINALVNGYADTSQACQNELQEMLETALGPEVPNADVCEDSNGLTCHLEFSKSEIAQTLLQLEDEANEAVSAVNSRSGADAAESMESVIVSVAELGEILEKLRSESKPSKIQAIIRNIRSQLKEINRGLDKVDDRYDDLLNSTERALKANNAIEEQRIELHGKICELSVQPQSEITDPSDHVEESALTEDDAKELLRIVGSKDCSGKKIVFPIRANTLESTIAIAKDEITEIRSLVGQTQKLDDQGKPMVDESGNPVLEYSSTARVRETADTVEQLVDNLMNTYNEDNTIVIDALDQFDNTYSDLKNESDTLHRQVASISEQLTSLDKNMETIFAGAKTTMNEQLTGVVDSSIEHVRSSKQSTSDEIEYMFGILSTELRDNSSLLVESGRDSIASQKDDLQQLGGAMSVQAKGQLQQGIASIDTAVTKATVDLGASNVLLTSDIQRVLADIGANSVAGGGLLGTIANSAATVGLADEQLTQASVSTLEFANSKRGSLGQNALANAQLRAAAARSEMVGPFMIDPDPNIDYTTVYNFNVGGNK